LNLKALSEITSVGKAYQRILKQFGRVQSSNSMALYGIYFNEINKKSCSTKFFEWLLFVDLRNNR